MYTFFNALIFITFIMFIASLIKPKWGTFGKRPDLKRKQISTVYFVLLMLFTAAANATTPEDIKIANQEKAEQQRIEQDQKKFADNNVFCKYYGFTVEQAKAIDSALESVGIASVKDSTKQSDNVYYLSVSAKDDGYSPADNSIHLFLDNDRNVTAIKLNAITLYENGAPVHQVNDFLLKPSEQATMITKSEEMVKKVLKAPSSAKFDSSTYKFYKKDGIATLIGTVDAQNSFGAMLRSNFKVQFDVNNDFKPIHMTFDAKELF